MSERRWLRPVVYTQGPPGLVLYQSPWRHSRAEAEAIEAEAREWEDGADADWSPTLRDRLDAWLDNLYFRYAMRFGKRVPL